MQRFERLADGEVVVVDTLPAVAQHRQRVGIYAAEYMDRFSGCGKLLA